MPLFSLKTKTPPHRRSVDAHLYKIGIPAVILELPFYWFNEVHTDYYAMVRASEAHAYAKQVAEGLSAGYFKHGKPPSLSDVKTEMSRPPEMKSLELSGDSTLLVHVANFDEGEDTLELVRTVNGLNQLRWTCHNVNLSERHIPYDCRTK